MPGKLRYADTVAPRRLMWQIRCPLICGIGQQRFIIGQCSPQTAGMHWLKKMTYLSCNYNKIIVITFLIYRITSY